MFQRSLFTGISLLVASLSIAVSVQADSKTTKSTSMSKETTMQQKQIELKPIRLMGLKARTNNKEASEGKGPIIPTMQQFFTTYAGKVKGATKPMEVIAVYTEYASNKDGDYTYFIGQEVADSTPIQEGLTVLTIPAQTYVQFTQQGVMPQVVVDMWGHIWGDKALDSKRAYSADFEQYNLQTLNTPTPTVNVFIGIKK